MKKAVFGLIILLALIGVVSGEIVITEIMYNPNDEIQCSDSFCEYVEIFNNGSSEVNLTGWSLCSDALITGYINKSNSSLSLDTTFILQSGSYALITDGGSGTLVYDIFNINSGALAFNVDPSSTMCSNKLNNSGETIEIYDNNSAPHFDITYSSSWGANGNLNSLQFCSGNWTENLPTPGADNNCTPFCTPNCAGKTCGSDGCGGTCGTCSSGYSCNASSQCIADADNDIYITLDWDEEDIVNDEEFEIRVKAYNLESESYDAKIEIQDEGGNLISERLGDYGDSEDVWKSGTYYAENFIEGSGDESKYMKIRIKSSYDDFEGDATIIAKIRENGKTTIIDEWEGDIEILEPEEESDSDDEGDDTESNSSDSNDSNGSTIELGSGSSAITGAAIGADAKGSIIYKSGNEYIKEYAVYGFGLLCVGLIILLIADKK